MRRFFIIGGALAMVAALGLAASQVRTWAASNEKGGVKVGDAAPKWEGLEGIDDAKHSLADLKDAKAVVVVFTCNHCPVAQAYEDRLVALHNDYKDKGVELVAVNVSNSDADRLPAMKEKGEEKGFEFEYLYDPSQAIGRAFGATVTPHVFLLDGSRKVAYIGAIDDDMNAAKAKSHYLRDALDAVLSGKAPGTPTSKPSGCGIHYE
jgi:peroxiredoxin